MRLVNHRLIDQTEKKYVYARFYKFQLKPSIFLSKHNILGPLWANPNTDPNG